MTLPRSWILTLAITAAVIIWMLSGVFVSHAPDNNLSKDVKTALPKVRVAQSIAQPMSNRLVLQGRTLADRSVTVMAETHGVIKKVLVERGASVTVNDNLVKITLDDRQARLLEARSLLVERKTEFEAVQSLKKSGYQAETELARAQAALDSAKAAVRLAELELKRTNVKAPIKGIVDKRFVEVGNFLNRGDPIATIVDLDPIRVTAQVSERYLGKIHNGKQGEVRLMDGTVVPAEVTYVGSSASDTTRTFPVEMQIPNPDGLIIEGITAELRLPIDQVSGHKVPPSVLSLLDNGELSIKAVDENQVIVTYPIQILGDSADGIWLGGLPSQLNLVVVGHEFVLPGQKVTPVAADSINNNN